MNTKLIVSIDKEVILKAKNYAKGHDTTLSSLIENYLKVLTSNMKEDSGQIKISPFVRSLSLNAELPPDFNYKEELTKILIEKYK